MRVYSLLLGSRGEWTTIGTFWYHDHAFSSMNVLCQMLVDCGINGDVLLQESDHEV